MMLWPQFAWNTYSESYTLLSFSWHWITFKGQIKVIKCYMGCISGIVPVMTKVYFKHIQQVIMVVQLTFMIFDFGWPLMVAKQVAYHKDSKSYIYGLSIEFSLISNYKIWLSRHEARQMILSNIWSNSHLAIIDIWSNFSYELGIIMTRYDFQ